MTSPTLTRRRGRPKAEDVISTSARWTDDTRRIIEGLSDAEIVMWHAMFRCWPPGRMSEARLKRIEEILARRSLERVVDNSASLARAAATIRAIGKEREGLAA